MKEGALKPCDLIMKGGVTSGVIYPRAVCELARDYEFRNIGGTSAGAIAAAATAAAELGRSLGRGASFAKLREIPSELGRNGLLIRLFKPDDRLRGVFHAVLSVASARSKPLALARAITAEEPGVVAVGVLLDALLFALSVWVLYHADAVPAALRAIALVYAIVLFLTGVILVYAAAGWRMLGGAIARLPECGFGFCPGYDPHAAAGQPPFVNWLHGLLNDLCGIEPGRPLTFGDLYRARGADGTTKKDINLEMVSTDLTKARPLRLPDDLGMYYFSSSEWNRFFPPDVLGWLVAHQREDDDVQTKSGERLCAFPEPADLPVIVAVRMSLSFPGLISALPVYSIDFSRPDRFLNKDGPIIADRCLLSDGGISSNFPIHFFDAPIPKWPTFGINLTSLRAHEGAPPPTDRDLVWMPGIARPLDPIWVAIEADSPRQSLWNFGSAIIGAMQNWRDTLQSQLPGFRERIVQIVQLPGEGGLNLNMSDTTLKKIADRGGEAGQLLRDDFDLHGHQWTRFRSTMAALEEFAVTYHETYRAPELAWVTECVAGRELPEFYKLRLAELRQATAAATYIFLSFATYCLDSGEPFECRPPRPTPDLRTVPQF